MTIVWKIKRGQIRPHVLKSYNLVLFDVTIVFWITHWLLFGNAEFRGSHYSGNDRSSSKKSQMRHKESIWENDELLRQYFSRKTGAWLLSQHRFLLVLVARSTTKNFDQSIHDCLYLKSGPISLDNFHLMTVMKHVKEGWNDLGFPAVRH